MNTFEILDLSSRRKGARKKKALSASSSIVSSIVTWDSHYALASTDILFFCCFPHANSGLRWKWAAACLCASSFTLLSVEFGDEMRLVFAGGLGFFFFSFPFFLFPSDSVWGRDLHCGLRLFFFFIFFYPFFLFSSVCLLVHKVCGSQTFSVYWFWYDKCARRLTIQNFCGMCWPGD